MRRPQSWDGEGAGAYLVAKTRCGFCEGAGKITNEHVLGEWLSALFGAGRGKLKMQNRGVPAAPKSSPCSRCAASLRETACAQNTARACGSLRCAVSLWRTCRGRPA